MVDKRVFLIVLDSFGVGELPDAAEFGDKGSNTLKTISSAEEYSTPNMKRLGLFNIDGVDWMQREGAPAGAFGKMKESSRGKDTTIGHWEISGIISPEPLPVYPDGFPEEVLEKFKAETGREILCNKPYSGTEVIKDYGEEHVKTGALIIYTSADSVFQIAAHEDVIPLEELYEDCEIARKILTGKHGVGRVIARPFTGVYPNYIRTSNRHDFSLLPPKDTMLDALTREGYETFGIGKIYDIFAGRGIRHTQRITGNEDGMEKTIEMQKKDFKGICFVNLVDFDMLYGHRNDIKGYAHAATVFDRQLETFLKGMEKRDILMITADHGCDPGFPGTDHTREHTPLLIYGNDIRANVNLGTRDTFADIAATILDIMEVPNITDGTSFKDLISTRSLLKHVDHTQLKAYATWEDIQKLCEEAVTYQTASVCIPPCYVKRVHDIYKDRLTICTVVGFPLGYSVTEAKTAETRQALEDGAMEIDMVVNISDVKNGDYQRVMEEIKALKAITGKKILKVIIETCYLTEEEKIAMCKAVTEAGADYIKTSTGFGTAGAALEDIRLFREHIGAGVRIKAAGGIKTVADMEAFLEEGCDRIGTSSAIQLIQGEEGGQY